MEKIKLNKRQSKKVAEFYNLLNYIYRNAFIRVKETRKKVKRMKHIAKQLGYKDFELYYTL